jgi:hypothetical protein
LCYRKVSPASGIGKEKMSFTACGNRDANYISRSGCNVGSEFRIAQQHKSLEKDFREPQCAEGTANSLD